MMKRIILPIIAALALASCSDIDSDERFKELDSVSGTRMILLEDFTGQECRNCPAAHEVIDLLSAQYPDNLIPVSIHAGAFGISATARRPGLMQPEGETYNDRYGIDKWPSGVVNGGKVLTYDQWGDAVRSAIERPSDLDIDLTASLTGAEPGEIAIECTLRPGADIAGALQVWVLEDGIVARQQNGDEVIKDYVHNHVFRAAVNGVDGENITLQSSIHRTITYTMPVRHTDKEQWNTANLSVVAFLRAADGTIVQAARAKVSK